MFTQEWMFEDDVYGQTCIKAVMASPAERLEMVDKWMNVLFRETEEAWRYEAWAHAQTVISVARDIGNRTVAPWDKKQDWQDYIRCSLNGIRELNVGRNESVTQLVKRGRFDLARLAGEYGYVYTGESGCIMRNEAGDEKYFELDEIEF